jgi:type IV pilus assembly protein PilW
MNRTRGFSLVEMMVAVTLGLVVSAAVVGAFVASRSSYQSTSGIANLSDSGRFALMYMENAVRNAGFMACGAATRTISNLNAEATNLFYAPGPSGYFEPMGGFEAASTGPTNSYTVSQTVGAAANWNPNLDGAFASIPAANAPIKNNDILVVRSSAPSSLPVYVTGTTATTFTINSPGTFATGQLAIVSDCTKSVLFQISSLVPSGTTATIGFTGGTGPGNSGVPPISIPTAFPTPPGGAEVMPLQTTIYYIGVGVDGDGALYSATMAPNNTLTVSELAPDIEAMQILYGVDTNSTLTVSEYETANVVPDFTQVMSVQIALLAAGPPGSKPLPTASSVYKLFGTQVTALPDTRIRQVFQVTVAARNALP